MVRSRQSHVVSLRSFLGIALWLVTLSASAADQDSTSVKVMGETLRVVIDPDSTPETAKAVQRVTVNEKLADVFGDQAIAWDPGAHLDKATLKDSTTDRELTVGKTRESAITIEHSRPHLRVGETADVVLRVNDPRSLEPGFFRGDLQAHMSSPSIGVELEYHWPLEVIVRGRRITSVQFSDADATQTMRIGGPTSVSIELETTDCDLAAGELELFATGTAKPQRLLWMPLPVAEDKPIDPLLDARLKGRVSPRWRDSVLLAPASTSTINARQKKHTVQAILPESFALGPLEARARWEKLAANTGDAPAAWLDAAPAHVLVTSGVLATPRMALSGEAVRVEAWTQSDLGPEVTATVTTAASPPMTVTLKKLPATPMSKATGYLGYAQPKTYGLHQVTLKPPREGAGEMSTSFSVVYGKTSTLGKSNPIVVFAGDAPFWLKWQGQDASRRVQHDLVLRLIDGSRSLTGLSVAQQGMFRWNGDLGPEVNPQQDPQIAFFSRDGKADDARLWHVPDRQSLDLGLRVQLPAPSGQAEALGPRDYAVRLLLSARDRNGQPVLRLVHVPVNLELRSPQKAYLVFGVLVALGLIVLAFVIFVVTKGRAAKLATTEGALDSSERPASLLSSGDDDDLLARPAGASAARATTTASAPADATNEDEEDLLSTSKSPRASPSQSMGASPSDDLMARGSDDDDNLSLLSRDP